VGPVNVQNLFFTAKADPVHFDGTAMNDVKPVHGAAFVEQKITFSEGFDSGYVRNGRQVGF